MKTFIIAEAGVNHNGNINLAYKLIEQAKEAGADCIKFQTFKAEKLVSINAQKAEYQKKMTGDSSQLEMLKKLELSYEDFVSLKAYCDTVGIMFLSTPFDFDSIEFLNSIEMPFWKIPSGEITNYPYLVALANTHRPVVMSTGMSDIEEIEKAIEVLRNNGTKDIRLLHCNTEYPTPFSDVNLAAINTMTDYFGLEVGYSDHTKGIEVAIAAVAYGAKIIEKHFTLDSTMEGPDHKASLEPDELKRMVSAIRNIEMAIGDGIKKPSNSELKNRDVARKSIVASRHIYKGELLSDGNVTTKRPGNGISPMLWNSVIGQRACMDFEEDELIKL